MWTLLLHLAPFVVLAIVFYCAKRYPKFGRLLWEAMEGERHWRNW